MSLSWAKHSSIIIQMSRTCRALVATTDNWPSWPIQLGKCSVNRVMGEGVMGIGLPKSLLGHEGPQGRTLGQKFRDRGNVGFRPFLPDIQLGPGAPANLLDRVRGTLILGAAPQGYLPNASLRHVGAVQAGVDAGVDCGVVCKAVGPALGGGDHQEEKGRKGKGGLG